MLVNRPEWETNAAAHNGQLLIWINQSEHADAGEGLCKAIAMDYITSCRGSVSDRIAFFNKFNLRSDDGALLKADVPAEYIEMQPRLEALQESRGAQVAAALDEIDRRKKLQNQQDKIEKLEELAKQLSAVSLGLWDCVGFEKASVDDLGELVDQLKQDVEATRDIFFKMVLSGGGTRLIGTRVTQEKRRVHEIAFGFRESQFQFMDANLGLFSFAKRSDMLDFFRGKVWEQLYKTKYHEIFGFTYDYSGEKNKSLEQKMQENDKALKSLLAELTQQADSDRGQEHVPSG